VSSIFPGCVAKMDRLEAAWLRSVWVAERAGALDEVSLSPSGALAAQCRLSHVVARRTLAAARALEELPQTREAALAGAVTPAHVAVLTSAFTPARAEALLGLEPELVDAACRFSAHDLRAIVKRVCDAIDGDGGAAAANEQHERRYLHVSFAFERMGVITGELDPEGTEIVITALETRMADDRDRPGDHRRSRPQRRADALVDICRVYLANDGRAPTRRRGRAHIGAGVDLRILRAEHAPVVAAIRGELEYTGAVSAATLRRLTCDCNIHRIITDGPSSPLDVGRATRTVPEGIWRALVARDRHCRAPGCDRPPGWCEAHHIVHWADGGPTNLENLQLLCWRHHRDHHEGAARAP